MSQADWDRATWPPECLASERLYRMAYARLFPLIAMNKAGRVFEGRVNTARGPGRLLSVGIHQCHVILDRPSRYGRKGKPLVNCLIPLDVWPISVRPVAGRMSRSV